jgi:hypothetical protein
VQQRPNDDHQTAQQRSDRRYRSIVLDAIRTVTRRCRYACSTCVCSSCSFCGALLLLLLLLLRGFELAVAIDEQSY